MYPAGIAVPLAIPLATRLAVPLAVTSVELDDADAEPGAATMHLARRQSTVPQCPENFISAIVTVNKLSQESIVLLMTVVTLCHARTLSLRVTVVYLVPRLRDEASTRS